MLGMYCDPHSYFHLTCIAQDIKRVADYVSQLRRVGKGLGVFEFDRYLLGGGAEGRQLPNIAGAFPAVA